MTASIPYPSFLERKLAGNREMRGAVDATVVAFESWLRDSKLPFFPDYTDHGATHLAEVLETASGLIRQPAIKFSPEDAAVLILAVLLHDAALHLSEAGFRELILGRAARNIIPGIDQTFWPELWNDFLFRAKRWDDRKLIDVFGSIEPGVPIGSVNDPFEHYDNLRETDRKLIGEFIRQHHPRLAHEIAIFGVPGPGPYFISPNQGFGPEKLDIAGLVARSHGLPVRDCLAYLVEQYHRREFQKVHAVYLMTLLRVADYLQIQSSRSSTTVFQYKHIASPRSQLEQRAHQAVRNITRSNEDPESIEVQAAPRDVEVFLHLQEWLRGIQAEIDASWAVLGEVYGADRQLSKLGLTIRRVHSNLEDAQRISRQADFFPARVEFDVAHAEVMKLLIRPLYGRSTGIGVRELMQNAIDAVRELWAWQERHPEHGSVLLLEQEGDVEIWLDEAESGDPGTLVVSDRGIGMTEAVIRDYFLRVGASYRHSYAWQQEFQISAESPRSRVLRSGRFGVGVLAAFLLGNEIEVSTRHVSADRGITFRTKLDAGPIELRYDETLRVGTTVRIRLNSVYLSDQDWDWYCFETPRVIRRKGPQRRILSQSLVVPDDFHSLPLGWYSLQTTSLAVYVGTYEVEGDRSPLVYNGIKIGDGASDWFQSGQGEIQLATPLTVVLDPDGKLPLNLQRTQLTEDVDFLGEVEKIICESILAGMLLNTPAKPPLKSKLDYLLPRFYRSWMEMVSFSPWLIAKDGISLADGWNFLQMDSDSVLVTFTEGIKLRHSSPCVIEGTFIYGEDHELEVLLTGGVLPGLELKGTRLLVTAEYGERILRLSEGDINLLRLDLKKEWTNGVWSFLTDGDCLATHIDFDKLPKPGRRSSIWPIAVEWFFDREPIEPEGLPRYWRDVIRHPIIPFNLEERRNKLAHAYAVLEHYFEEHRDPSKLERRNNRRKGRISG